MAVSTHHVSLHYIEEKPSWQELARARQLVRKEFNKRYAKSFHEQQVASVAEQEGHTNALRALQEEMRRAAPLQAAESEDVMLSPLTGSHVFESFSCAPYSTVVSGNSSRNLLGVDEPLRKAYIQQAYHRVLPYVKVAPNPYNLKRTTPLVASASASKRPREGTSGAVNKEEELSATVETPNESSFATPPAPESRDDALFYEWLLSQDINAEVYHSAFSAEEEMEGCLHHMAETQRQLFVLNNQIDDINALRSVEQKKYALVKGETDKVAQKTLEKVKALRRLLDGKCGDDGEQQTSQRRKKESLLKYLE